MVCLRNVSVDTLHKGDSEDNNNNNNNNNNNYNNNKFPSSPEDKNKWRPNSTSPTFLLGTNKDQENLRHHYCHSLFYLFVSIYIYIYIYLFT